MTGSLNSIPTSSNSQLRAQDTGSGAVWHTENVLVSVGVGIVCFLEIKRQKRVGNRYSSGEKKGGQIINLRGACKRQSVRQSEGQGKEEQSRYTRKEDWIHIHILTTYGGNYRIVESNS